MKRVGFLLGLFALIGLAWATVYRSAQPFVAASPVTGSAPSSTLGVCTGVLAPVSPSCGVNLSGVDGIRVCVASKNLTTGAPSGALTGTGSLVGYLYDFEPDGYQQPTPNARWKLSGSLTLTIPASCTTGDCCFSDVTTRVKAGRALWVPSGVGYAGGSATGVEVSEEAYYAATPQ